MGSEREAVQRGTGGSHETGRESPLNDLPSVQEDYVSTSVLNTFQNALMWGGFVCGCLACSGRQRRC